MIASLDVVRIVMQPEGSLDGKTDVKMSRNKRIEGRCSSYHVQWSQILHIEALNHLNVMKDSKHCRVPQSFPHTHM